MDGISKLSAADYSLHSFMSYNNIFLQLPYHSFNMNFIHGRHFYCLSLLLPSGVTQSLISKRDNHWLWCLFKLLLLQSSIIGHGQRNHSRFSDCQIYTYWSSCSINPISYDNTNHFPYQYSMQGEYRYLCLSVSCEELTVSLDRCLLMVSLKAQLLFRLQNLDPEPYRSLLQRTWSAENQEPRGLCC